MREEQLLPWDYPTISVVIPALNEAPNLRYMLPLIPPLVSEVILVDGHSTDDTLVVAQRLLSTIRIIKQDGKGKGNALKTGFAACTGDIIVTPDADGSTNPQEIPRFIEALLEGFDFAKGSRFLQGGGSHDITYLRQLGNYGLSRFVNLLFWTRFSDRKALPQIQSLQLGATFSESGAQQHTSSLFFRGRVLSAAHLAEVFSPDEKV